MKKDLTTWLLMALVVLAYAFWPRAEPEIIQVPVTVTSGDTLFNICGELKAEYGDKRNIQEIVYYARKQNGLQGKKYIYAGDRLVIEIEKGR